MPWSYRQIFPVRLCLSLLAGILSAAVGTLAHRMGAAYNIPYGLILAFVILLLSAWSARSRSGVVGLLAHTIAATVTAWGIAVYGPGGDALVPVGFNGQLPFFSQHVGYIWLYGAVLVQIVLLFLPKRWFTLTTQSRKVQGKHSFSSIADGIHHRRGEPIDVEMDDNHVPQTDLESGEAPDYHPSNG